ncbi:MAG TPA: TIM barrel protein [Bacteroidales bacterium]|jgi:sugar phosphate isomerase/epimerase|nr:TIM barrel protein [Bacteroidales bacterium]HQH25077.1 TIM barrel protein [Bacteroidales bacterium]HQJ82723.1 TIM barrel protein [Bacteroidales bacterium]
MKQNRREFITKIAAAAAAIPFAKIHRPAPGNSSAERFPVRLFSKPLDEYDFSFMCECLKRSGIGGFDLTVRPGGKVIPERVENDLPRLAEEAEKYGLVLDMMVTSILYPDEEFTEKILKTASMAGVSHYRLGWAEYEPGVNIMKALQGYKYAMKGIAGLNEKYNIRGGYQNHAGTWIGGPVWDLYELLKDLPPEFIGCQYDVRHAMVEGTNSWILGLKLLLPMINSLAVKDYTWQTVKGRPMAVTVPLGEGMVNWDLFFGTLRDFNVSAPVTLHVEYPWFSKAEEGYSLIRKQDIIVKKLKKDMDFLNGYLSKYNLV